jgi:hypothetical protein
MYRKKIEWELKKKKTERRHMKKIAGRGEKKKKKTRPVF